MKFYQKVYLSQEKGSSFLMGSLKRYKMRVPGNRKHEETVAKGWRSQ